MSAIQTACQVVHREQQVIDGWNAELIAENAGEAASTTWWGTP